MIIALFANMEKRHSFEIACAVRDFLKERKVKVVARNEEAKELSVPSLSTIKPEEIDFLISMGGDGTILRLAHHFPQLKAPILGINLGHLGFMADIPLSDLYPSLEALLAKEFVIEERVRMEGVSAGGERCFAVNDIVFHRSRNPSLIDLSVHVDGTYLNTFSADGLIIATPSGSTAYSLAAGGPILTPELPAFVLTPISPHTISNRPVVLMPHEKLEVQYLSPYEPVEITYDGISRYTMATNDTFTIAQSKHPFRMVNLKRTDYFTTLRTKLGWAGQVRHSLLNHIEEERD